MGKKTRDHYRKTVTPDRLAFVNEYCLNGNNATAAYKKVYKKLINDNPGLSDAAIRNRANEKFKDPVIHDLIKKRVKKMEERYEISTKKIIEELMDMIENCKLDSDRQNLLKSIDILNKMSGAYVHKQEVDIKSEGIVINYIKPEDGTRD